MNEMNGREGILSLTEAAEAQSFSGEMKRNNKTICIVSPFPPPFGGMAVQAQKMVSLLKESGFKVTTVRTNPELSNKFISQIRGIRTLIRVTLFLRNLHKNLRYADVIYFLTGFTNFFFWITYPALILIKLHGKRVILSARGGGAKNFFRRYGILVKPVLRRVDIISSPSGFLQDIFKKILSINSIIIPNIADLEQFEFCERLSVQPNFLSARNLEKIYNVACVIRAFKRVHDRFPKSTLGIAGDGSQRSKLEQLVGELGLNNCVTFYGIVEHAKILDLYDQYDIYVNASNVDNLPGVILEAYASGLPVVSTRAGGIPYIVKDGVTGLLVDKGDCDALAERMIRLVEQPKLASTLAKNARKESQKYSRDRVKEVLLPLLKSVANK